MNKTALSNLNVIDFTRFIAGPYCTKLLAGFGAEIVKIERPLGGDPMRSAEPLYEDRQGNKHSIPFLWLNTGKKSLSLDLKSSCASEIVERLVENADIVVENFAPGVMQKFGFDFTRLKSINPKLVMVSISNFGQTGPYRDYLADEMGLQALSGLMDNTGSPNREPLSTGPALSQLTAGVHAYTAILTALVQRNRTGRGVYVDLSIMESSMELIENRLNTCLLTGKVVKRGPHAFAPWGLYRCRDGYANVISAPFRHWKNAADLFDEPRLSAKRFQHLRERVKHRQEIDSLIQPWLDRKSKLEVFEAGQKKGLSFGYLASLQEVMQSPQHRAREFFRPAELTDGAEFSCCDAPFKMSASPWVTGRPPALGEDNESILESRLGYSAEQRRLWQQQGAI